MTGPQRSGRRIAVNPIPYWIEAGRTREVLDVAFTDLAEIGFTAVKADVPEGMEVPEYLSWLEGHGLAPALSLFSSPFDETVEQSAEVERARRFGAQQAALGMDRTMVSSMPMPARIAEPGVGAGFDADRLARAVERCGEVCVVLAAEGVRPLHHSHVGGVFETEHDVTTLLDTLGAHVIGFGPDTGHLRWAGADPATLIRRYADRLGALHVKDVFGDWLDPDARAGHDYREQSRSKRLWAEPGLGVVDFDAVVAAVPEGFDGDWMIEVDEPSVDSLRESHAMSFAWAQRALG